jgi:hypothetical protein
VRKWWLESQRVRAIRNLEKRRESRVIGLIHRQETMNFLGFPLARYIAMSGGTLLALGADEASGTWTHDYPITVGEARELGLAVSTDMPDEVFEMMQPYPQTAQRRPSVEYVPLPYGPRERPLEPARTGTRSEARDG